MPMAVDTTCRASQQPAACANLDRQLLVIPTSQQPTSITSITSPISFYPAALAFILPLFTRSAFPVHHGTMRVTAVAVLWVAVQLVLLDQLFVVWGQGTQSSSSGGSGPAGGSGVCTVLSSAAAGDVLSSGLLSRAPRLNLNFSSSPACTNGGAVSNWQWAASDPTDSASDAALHQGVALLNGSVTSYIDLTTGSGPQSGGAGGVLPLFGGPGYDGSGWSIELVMKFPTVVQNLGSCLYLFQDAADSYLTMVWGRTFDTGEADVGNRLEANNVNDASTGVPTAATSGHIEFFVPNNQTWYHMVWTLAPYPNPASGTALWSLYINGQLLNYASRLVPSSTLTPIQGANYPQMSNRTVANLGKDSSTNTFIVTVDAFRVYDYLLPAATVGALANAYGLNISQPAASSFAYPPTAETSALLSLVPTRPIFNAPFGQNPTSNNPAIPYTNYQWAPSDVTDSALLQALHPGVILLNGNASSYINLQQSSGPNSCGLVVPIIGTAGSGTGTSQGLSFEMVFKLPSAYPIYQSSKVFDLGQGGTETIDVAVQTSGSLQLEQQNNLAPGVEYNEYQATYTAQYGFTTGVWYHVVWVLSSPSFTDYTATWTAYVNGTLAPFIGAPFNGTFPLPVYRPLSYIGGSDYWNGNLPLVMDAFRIYDYALSASTVSLVYNTLYNPATAGQSSSTAGAAPSGPSGGSTGPAGGSGVCTVLSSAAAGDVLSSGLLSRAPRLNLNFSSSPACTNGGAVSNWQWAASDPTDSASDAALHQGVALLNGSVTSYIDLTTGSGPQSGGAGGVLPLFGGPGYDGSGWSIELVMKFPTVVQNLGSCLYLFQDAADSYLTMVWGRTFDTGEADVGNRLEANNVNDASTGVPTAATSGHIEFFVPNNQTWYHMVWTLAPYPNPASGTALWSLYINGQLLNYASRLVPSSTLTPIQGANYPQMSNRTVANLGKDSFTNTFIVTVDAFRVYDYLLPAATVGALANAYGLNISQPAASSFAYPPTAETSALLSLVPTRPIFNAPFGQNPTSNNPAIPYTNYQWAPSDVTDSALLQALHPGVILLNGNASSYINLQQSSGPNSCGLVVPIIGTAGSGTGTSQGLSFEMVFKLPSAYPIYQSSKVFDLGQGGTETIDVAVQTSGSLQLEQQNNLAPGVEYNEYQATYTAQYGFTTGVWYHVVWVLSSPSFTDYTATWTAYVNGTLAPFIGAPFNGTFPLPVYRPLSYIGGSDYWNGNLPLVMDAFRIYDYALSASTVSLVYNTLYNPATAGQSSSTAGAAPSGPSGGSTGPAGGSGVCTVLSSAAAGDVLSSGLLSRAPRLNLNFSSSPACTNGGAVSNWQWAASDPTDSASDAALHQGVALLNGSVTSYIDLTTGSGPQSGGAGGVLPLFGGPGYDGSGWSIELVMKFPTVVQNLGSCLYLFQDAADSYLTMVWGRTFDTGEADVGNRLEANNVNDASTGVPTAATSGHIEFFVPNNQTWYHMVWTLAPYPNPASGTALWSLYINGQLLNYASRLVPSSTLTPIQGANYPQMSNRTVANLGKDSFTNTFIVTVDAFRVYDYLLPAATVGALANAYGLNISQPAASSFAYPPTAETSALLSLVPTGPIFNAPFGQNPTSNNPAIPYTNYQWAPSDVTDSALLQALHPGVILLNGNASSYINLQQSSGPNSCGLVVPIIGTAGSGTGTSQGLSFEMVFKLPSAYPIYQSSKVFDLGQGGTETIDVAVQTSGSLQLEQQNNLAPGVEYNEYQATYTAQYGFTTGVWYHVVWVLSSPSFTDYTATWTAYVNGTLAPFIGAPFNGTFPLPVYRPLSYIGGSDYWNGNLPLVMDAFRIYDYALSASTVSLVYNTLYNPATAGQSSSTAGAASATSSSSSQAASATSTAAGTSNVSPISSSSSAGSATGVSNSGGSSGLSHGAIAGIVIGSVAGVALVLVLLAVLCCGRRDKGNKFEDDHTTDHAHDVEDSASPAEVEMEHVAGEEHGRTA